MRFSCTERIRSHYGALEIAGVEVEIMGDVQKRLPGKDWDPPTDIVANRIWLDVEDIRIPVLTLAYEQQSYLAMGRLEKAELLRRHLQTSENT